MNLFKNVSIATAGTAVTASQAFAQAVGPDMSSLTSAVSVGTVITAVLAIFAIGIGLTLAFKGGEKANSAIKKL